MGLSGRPHIRHMGTGIKDVAPEVLTKARKLAVAVGAMAGVFGGLVGVGGGVLISPIIANACRTIPQRVISGTSLAAVATCGAAAGSVYAANGAVDATSAAVLAAMAVGLAPLGARAAHAVDCNKLRRIMGYWLLFVAPLVPLKSYLMPRARPSAVAAASSSGAADAPASGPASAPPGISSSLTFRPLRGSDAFLAATGAVAGFASGLLGIGGGTIVTPALAVATGMPQVMVLGTSLAAMIVPSLVGLTQHAMLGNVDWRMAAGMALGTLVGGSLGGKLAVAAPDGALEWCFCAGMLLLGFKTLRVAAAIKAGGAVVKGAVAPAAAGAAPTATVIAAAVKQ